MIGNWQIAHLNESQRFILYATAYLEASRSVCHRMLGEDRENIWPNASVAMMLTAHALELLFKGAIISRDPDSLANTHRIERLAETYFKLFPEDEFVFEVPFQGECPGFSEEESALLKKNLPLPSILYRYPVESHGLEWKGVEGFEVQGFLGLIAELSDVFSRVGARIQAHIEFQ